MVERPQGTLSFVQCTFVKCTFTDCMAIGTSGQITSLRTALGILRDDPSYPL